MTNGAPVGTRLLAAGALVLAVVLALAAGWSAYEVRTLSRLADLVPRTDVGPGPGTATAAPHGYAGDLYDPTPGTSREQGSFVAQLGRGPYALDSFRNPPAVAPAPGQGPGTNVLVVTTDLRGTETSAAPTSSFGIVLAHLDAGRDRLDLVEVPTTLHVPVPGYGYNRLGSAWAQGGPALLRDSVEALTGVRVDDVVTLDVSRCAALVDAFGGVELDVDDPTPLFPVAEKVHASGGRALWFTREPKTLAGTATDVEHRRAAWLRALLRRAGSPYLLASPAVLHAARGATACLTLDTGVTRSDVASLAHVLVGLGEKDVVLRTVVALPGTDAYAGPVESPDPDRLRELSSALRDDALDRLG